MTCMQEITPIACQNGTYLIPISATDENGDDLLFEDLDTPQWQIMRASGEVVNGRTFAASSMTGLSVLLKGDDLKIFGPSDRGERVFSFQAKYNSSAGSDLPLVAAGTFNVRRVLGQL